MFYLVTLALWVTANFKETQLNRMRPGQPVSITADAYPALTLHGHVDSIQAGSGDRFSTFPAENATGNYVKIVRRRPVKIIIDSGVNLLRMARAQQAAAALSYRGTVLNALREVEDGLVAYRTDRAARDQLAATVALAADSLYLAKSRYANGLGDFL